VGGGQSLNQKGPAAEVLRCGANYSVAIFDGGETAGIPIGGENGLFICCRIGKKEERARRPAIVMGFMRWRRQQLGTFWQ
jgi:hypothetical protein